MMPFQVHLIGFSGLILIVPSFTVYLFLANGRFGKTGCECDRNKKDKTKKCKDKKSFHKNQINGSNVQLILNLFVTLTLQILKYFTYEYPFPLVDPPAIVDFYFL